MTEMVERVARAICVAAHEDPDMLITIGEPIRVRAGFAGGQSPIPNWRTYAEQARAAISAALREGEKG